jgi:hypothetical protein
VYYAKEGRDVIGKPETNLAFYSSAWQSFNCGVFCCESSAFAIVWLFSFSNYPVLTIASRRVDSVSEGCVLVPVFLEVASSLCSFPNLLQQSNTTVVPHLLRLPLWYRWYIKTSLNLMVDICSLTETR